MNSFARCSLVIVTLAFAAPAFGQQPAWSYPALTTAAISEPLPPAPVAPATAPPNTFPTYAPERPIAVEELPRLPQESGQQHWVSLNLSVFQPFVGRLGVKVWSRPNNSVWVEAYAGSVLFEAMVGLGVRVQHTAYTFGSGGRLMVGPGVGVHVIPVLFGGTATYLAGDVDLSWLHDFTPHFGFEMGVKLGLAGHLSGSLGRRYARGVMFGRDLYPILAVYSGFRF